MVEKRNGITVETPTEARQAELGLSIFSVPDDQYWFGNGDFGRNLVRVLSSLRMDEGDHHPAYSLGFQLPKKQFEACAKRVSEQSLSMRWKLPSQTTDLL